MLRLNPRQRQILTDKVPDVANLVFAAIVIGRFLGEPRASWRVMLAGIALWAAAMAVVVMMSREES